MYMDNDELSDMIQDHESDIKVLFETINALIKRVQVLEQNKASPVNGTK